MLDKLRIALPVLRSTAQPRCLPYQPQRNGEGFQALVVPVSQVAQGAPPAFESASSPSWWSTTTQAMLDPEADEVDGQTETEGLY